MESATQHNNSLHNSYQKPLVNLTSRSLTIFSGIPNLQTQCSQNNYKHSKADMDVQQGINIHKREKWSTMLKLASNPCVLTGR